MKNTAISCCSFPDDNAGAMIDEEAFSDLRARVNIDPRFPVGHFGYDPRDKRRAEEVQPMGQAMVDDRKQGRIADQHFIHTAGRRITAKCCADIGIEQDAQLWQLPGKIAPDIA